MKSEAENEPSKEDPYAGDTDVDSDGDTNMEHAIVSCPSSSSLRRGRNNIFSSSFDTSDSPNSPPILPKRARASQAVTASASTSTTSVQSVLKDVCEDGEVETATSESTQDLISQM